MYSSSQRSLAFWSFGKAKKASGEKGGRVGNGEREEVKRTQPPTALLTGEMFERNYSHN